MNKIEIKTALVKKNDKESVIQALCEISNFDNDFNGENGEEYLTDNALAEGFKSNQEYVCSLMENYDNLRSIIARFFEEWLDHDNYYELYTYEIIENDKGEILAIVLAYNCDE